MGGLLAAASISAFIALLALVPSIPSGGTGGFFMIIALAINVIAVIRLFFAKKNEENVKFKISQLVYIVSVIVCALASSYVSFVGWAESAFMSFVFYISFAVMLLDGMVISFSYLGYHIAVKNTGEGNFFMPTSDSRNIKKPLRTAFYCIGAILIVVAICLFLVGVVDSSDSGDVAFTSCYKCDGVGAYENKKGVVVTCDSCNGNGIGAYRESGENIMLKPALWFAIVGIGLLVIARTLTDSQPSSVAPSVTATTKPENLTKAQPSAPTIINDTWICGNCNAVNSLNYGQCKKCGKFKSSN